VRKDGAKRSLGRPRIEWGDTIKIGLMYIGCGGMKCLDVSQSCLPDEFYYYMC
jgi:hypothetical protein